MVNKPSLFLPPGCIRGAYSKLLPQYYVYIDYYLQIAEAECRLSERYLKTSSQISSIFFLHFQELGYCSVTKLTEDIVADFFVKDGQPQYSSTWRRHLVAFLKAISNQYPECSQIIAWIPTIRTNRKNIQYLADKEVQAIRVYV